MEKEIHFYLNLTNNDKRSDMLYTFLDTKTVIEKHIHRYRVEEQSYKGCMSILKLADKYTAQRLENACAIALEHIPNPTYKNIRLILEAGQDEMISKENEDDTSIQEHAILRGADYYRRK